MIRQALLVAGVLAALVTAPAGAVTVTGLYSVDVPVQGSSPDQLSQGYADGLQKVLVRVSGSRDVLQNDGVRALLDDAESLLQSYQVVRSDDGDRLRLSFGAVGVNNALASVNAPVWGANRPLTLAWVAVEERGSRSLLTASGDSAWSRAFLRAAVDRGLPLALPPEDRASDRELLSDIWGQFASRVKSRSENIGHDVMAMVRVNRSGGQWRAGWVFDGMGMDEGEQSVTAATEQELAEKVIGLWADVYASRYAVAAGDVGDLPKVDIVVRGVGSLQDYASIVNVLDDLTPVQTVDASRVAGEQLTLRVAFSGELDQLREYIALDTRFVPLTDAEAATMMEGGQRSETSASASGGAPSGQEVEPSTGNVPDAGESLADPLFVYQPLLGDAEESEEAFESLYEILHYRWQPGSVIGSDAGE